MQFSRTEVLSRYRTVLRVLSRHGFGALAAYARFSGRDWWVPGRTPAQPASPGRGERLRQACEELGPTFIKLGQMLSTRTDLLPADLIAGLERLQDRVAPVPFEQIRDVVEHDLKAPLTDRYASVEPEPIAAASLGQVHRALLPGGRDVVIKVQRPGVARQVELDLHVLLGLADSLARRTQWGRNYDLPGVAREFADMLRAELDFEQEGRNADRFRGNFQDDREVGFPEVVWECTSSRVLTLQRVGGLRVTDRTALKRAGLQPKEVALRLTGAVFRMVLRDGFFHADPHPGNLFADSTGRIIFVDLGMVGELTPAMKENVVDYVLGVVGRDPDRVADAIMRMGIVRRHRIRSELRTEVERLQRKYGEVPLRQVQLGPALRETLAMARRFEITFPTGYTVLLKSLTTLEAVCRQIAPEATLVELAAPYANVVMRDQLHPQKLAERAAREMVDAGRHLLRLPRQVSRVLGQAEQGELRMAVDHSGLEPALRRLSAIANRLALSILLASLIIGTALVSGRGGGSLLQAYPIADAGFILIGAFGLWLVLSILRSRSL